MKPRIRIAAIVLVGLAVTLVAFDFSRKQPSSYAFTPSEKPAKSSAANSPPQSASSADLELGKEIDRAINESELAQARWGVFLISLRDGRVIYSRDGDKLFTPASNMKIYTTAVALDLLGADYRWRTSVYAHARPDSNGSVNGDLTLYGRGAPDLISQASDQSSLAQLADALYNRGIRRITGNVVGDESYFRGNPFGDGWLWNDIQWYFGAEASALSINFNQIDLNVTPAGTAGDPATVLVDKGSDYFHVVNNVATVERNVVPRVGINRGLSNNEFVVWGEFPAGGRGFGARLSVSNPALWAAHLFKTALAARGIAVEGRALSRDFRVVDAQAFKPQQAVELAAVTSKTLGDVVFDTNKKSINLNAELILRTLGKERGALVPVSDEHQRRERGDDEAGLAIIRSWLGRVGIRTGNLALHDGSGLSRLNLVTPEATARLLLAISKTSGFANFRTSLPMAGKDGTLMSRMRVTDGRIAAKTGSLTYNDALAGYATTLAGEEVAFSIICNDATIRASSTPIIDRIALAVAGHPHPDSPKSVGK